MARYKFRYGEGAADEYSSHLKTDRWYDGDHQFIDNVHTVATMAMMWPKEWIIDEPIPDKPGKLDELIEKWEKVKINRSLLGYNTHEIEEFVTDLKSLKV